VQPADGSPEVKRWEAPLQSRPINPYSCQRHLITEMPGLGGLRLAEQLLRREGGAVVRDDPNPRPGASAGPKGSR